VVFLKSSALLFQLATANEGRFRYEAEKNTKIVTGMAASLK
jgi:hypothetical protein